MIRLYFDLDGVLVDFYSGIYEKYGLAYPTEKIEQSKFDAFQKELFDNIKKDGVDFWKSLRPLQGAVQMYRELIKHADHVGVITAYPRTFTEKVDILACSLGKKFWIESNLDESLVYRTDVCKASDKHLVARKFPNDVNILIDDMESNINDWNNAGGIGILHKSPADTISEFYQKVKI
jgi:hypothetical protein